MRTFVRWVAGLAGIATLIRLVTRKSGGTVAPAAPPETDPAEELRQKLADVRAAEPAATASPEAASEPDAPTASIDERRAAIHARAQEAIDAMREGEP